MKNIGNCISLENALIVRIYVCVVFTGQSFDHIYKFHLIKKNFMMDGFCFPEAIRFLLCANRAVVYSGPQSSPVNVYPHTQDANI